LTGGTITTTKAAMILGVRPKNVSRLIAEAHTAREGAPAGRT
jgi:plasmid maintenance system antidote protein VapI